MGCPETSQLLEFAEGALDTTKAIKIEDHLDACPICRRLVAAAVHASPDAAVVRPAADRSDARQHAGVELTADQRVDHFVVIRSLGRGGMGQVYLARDTQLGRKVALKVIQQGSHERSTDAAATAQHERLLREARATACFSHPNIVTIYAVGEHQGLPYLALEYLDGETLQQRALREGFSLPQALRIGLAIARALTEAHARGILHRDLKPANVMLTRDGRVRVLDFGLAKDPAEAPPRGVHGTPAYMAPEQWSCAADVTAAVDVWSLGVILYELLCGCRPYGQSDLLELREAVCSAEPVPALDTVRSSIPVEVSQLVTDCLDKQAKSRPAAARLVERLLQLIGHEQTPSSSSDESPFRGLYPFEESHARFFYGRDDEIAAVLERLREQTVLPIVGPSGSGKSSFIQAGLIPRLREQGELLVVQLRPGSDPFASLIAALQRVQDSPSGVGSVTPFGVSLPPSEQGGGAAKPDDRLSRLRDQPSILTLLLQRVAAKRRCSVLLFVDQLEEICTLVSDEDEQRRFMEAICSAADDPSLPLRVVVSLREEFLSRLAQGPAARAALSQIQVLRCPDRAALRETLTCPLQLVGYSFDDPSLPDEMVDGVGGEPASLPLLQFAGQLLWTGRDRDRRLLLRSRYDEMGGVAGALARHADGVLSGLSPPQVLAARAVLLALITPEGTRRTLGRQRLAQPDAEDVIDRLVSSRLLTESSADDREPQLELVHESLVVNWKTLRRWLDESREELVERAELEDAFERWQRHGGQDHDLLRSETLRAARRLAQRGGASFPEALERFIAAGERRERRLVRRRRLAVLAAFVLLAAVTVLIATKERQTRQAHNLAERGRSEALREGARAARARGDLLEARARLRSALEVEDSVSARALWRQLRRDPLLWHRELSCFLYTVAASPSGDRLAVAGADQAVYVIDVRTRAILSVLRGHADQVFALAFTPDGQRLVSATWGGELWIWTLQHRRHRAVALPSSGAIWGVAISTDGATLAVAHDDQRVWLVDLRDSTRSKPPRALVGHRARVHSVSFSADGRWLASASADGTARLWHLPSGAPSHELVGHGRNVRVRQASFSADSRQLVTAGADAMVRVWDVASGSQKRVLRGHTARVYSAVFVDNDRRIASAGEDKVLRIWDAASGREQDTLVGHSGRVFLLHPLPSHPLLLASVSGDASVRLWDLRRARSAGPLRRAVSIVDSVAFSPDRRTIAAAVNEGVVLWDVDSGRARSILRGHEAGVLSSSFSPDGRLLASASWDKTARVYDLATGAVKLVLRGHTAAVRRAVFSPDGTLLATSGADAQLRLWRAADGQQQRVLDGHSEPVMDLCFSPDGKHLVSASHDRTIRVWPMVENSSPRVLRGHEGGVNRVCYGSSAEMLYSVGDDGTLRRWDLSRGPTSQVVVRVEGRLTSLAALPDGRLIYTSPAGVVLADERGRQLARLVGGHRLDTNEVAISTDGRLAATGGNDRAVRLFDLPSGRPRWRTSLFLPAEGLLVTHRGLQRLQQQQQQRQTQGAGKADDRVRLAARDVQLAAQLRDGRQVCRLTFDGRLELWDLSAQRAVVSAAVKSAGRDLQATQHGCVLLTDAGGVLALQSDHSTLLVDRGASAVGQSPSGVLVAAGGQLLFLSLLDGRPLRPAIPVDPGVTALKQVAGDLLIGYREGNIERRSAWAEPGVAFEAVPSSAVVRLVDGPRGTIAASFADGTIGLWSAGGRRLDATRLHGAPLYLHWADGLLLVATELGDHLSWNLKALARRYCPMLREIWREVPLRWQDGAAKLAPAPTDHRCAAVQSR